MRFEEYALKILQSTEASYVGLELDLRFDVIDFLRKKLSDMTQAKLAAKLKMKPSQLNRILRAESNMTLETIARIYHIFGSRPTIKEKYAIHEAIDKDRFPIKQQVIYDAQKEYSYANIGID